MKLVDANLLIYTAEEGAPQFEPAVSWLDRALNGRETVAFAWVSLLAYLRVTTHAGIFRNPHSAAQAADVIKTWVELPQTVVLEPGRRHLYFLKTCLEQAGTAGNLVNDAHLAALALEHGADVVSFDHDFARFDGVSWVKPGR